MRTELTPEERAALVELERGFGYAAAWGSGPEPSLFALRAAALGPAAESYVSIFFRALHRLAAGLDVSFEHDVARHLEFQPIPAAETRDALRDLTAEYFDAHPAEGARVQILALFGDLAKEPESLAGLGVRASARQIVAMSEDRWIEIAELRRRALESFAAAET